MTTRLTTSLGAIALTALSGAIAPIGTLYFTKNGDSDFDATEVGMLTGPSTFGFINNVTTRPTVQRFQAPIAVAGNDVRTFTSYYGGSGSGSRYDLSLNYLNQDYGLWGTGPGSIFYDGTSDGQFNYTVTTRGTIVRTDRDWQNPLFVNPSGFTGFWMTGITWDFTDDTLWLASLEGSVFHVTKSGSVLGSFQVPISVFGLAMDVDGSLWMLDVSELSPQSLTRYTRSGANIGVAYVPGFNHRAQGIEIQLTTVPEPTTLSAALAGLAGLGLRRRWPRRLTTVRPH